MEARAQQIRHLLQEKGVIRERVRRIVDYIAVKCSSCEDMTRSMFFDAAMTFVRKVMEDLHNLQGDLARTPVARPNDVLRAPGVVEVLMYS